MSPAIKYEKLSASGVHHAVDLILAVFTQHVAPDFSAEGIAEFRRFVTPEAVRQRMREGSVLFAARQEEELVGVAEIRPDHHLCMLFVESSRQQAGIGEQLLHLAAGRCRNANGRHLSVNASPNARGFYERMGFATQSEEQLMNGIRFIPMRLEL